MFVFISARCCWPTDSSGKWEANSVVLTATVSEKSLEGSGNTGVCLTGNCDDIELEGDTIITGCTADQGVAAKQKLIGPKLTAGGCQALRYDAGALNLGTICTTYKRLDNQVGTWNCAEFEGSYRSLGQDEAYCPDNGSGQGSNWRLVGCSSTIIGTPTNEQCEANPFASYDDPDIKGGFNFAYMGGSLDVNGGSCTATATGQGYGSAQQRVRAKCCKIDKYYI